MSQTTGRIGPYPVERELGRGGMGIVYLARDPRLDRPVAIKVLPDAFAGDAERLARFEREARLLASLRHPNIAGIYGIEDEGGRRFLSLEYVEGPTLAERLRRGPLPVREALEVCAQIAAALEAAHEAGIVHRDLKPGNVKITPAGEVKVLDFGLAKGPPPSTASSDPDLSNSPTVTASPTAMGVILGTAAYMSPEQARGKAVDRRTDVWSLGCVFYECLTGRLTFEGETVSDTIAKILEREPDWAAIPSQTPPKARELLRRCLEKDARKRLRDAGDARLELEAALGELSESGRVVRLARAPGARGVAMLLAGALVGVALAAGAWMLWGAGGTRGGPAGVARLSVTFPSELSISEVRISPDGSMLVAQGRPSKAGGPELPRLYLRRLDAYEMKALPGTEGVIGFGIDYDSRRVGFGAPVSPGAQQVRMAFAPLDGSAPPVTFAQMKPDWSTATSLRSHELLLLKDGGTRLVRLSPQGRETGPGVSLDMGETRGRLELLDALPGDRGVLANVITYGARGWYYQVGVLDPRSGKLRVVAEDGGNPVYSPTGHLLFARGDALLAARFDLGRLEVKGNPVALMDGMRTALGVLPAPFSLSENGTLVYAPGGRTQERRTLAVVEADGSVRPLLDEPRAYRWVTTSARDGKVFAACITNAQGLDEVWVSETDRPHLRRLVAMPDADCSSPQPSPDGRWVAFHRGGRDERDGLYVVAMDGAGTPRRVAADVQGKSTLVPTSWVPDGSAVVAERREGDARFDLVLVPIPAAAESLSRPVPLVATGADELEGFVSPDGKWFAFTSDESGRREVYLASFGSDGRLGNAQRLSREGGRTPLWWPEGRRITFVTLDEKLMTVDLQLGAAPSASTPAPWRDAERLRLGFWDALPGGRLLAVVRSPDETRDLPGCNVVLNFTRDLRERVARQQEGRR